MRQRLPEVGDGRPAGRDGRPGALHLPQPPLDPGPQLDDRRGRRAFGRATGEHDLDAARRVDGDPDAPGPFRAPDLVGDATRFHGGTGYGAATTMSVIPALASPLIDGDLMVRAYAERDIPEILIAFQDDPDAPHPDRARAPAERRAAREPERDRRRRADRGRAPARSTIAETETDTCRGRISVHHFDWDHRRAELGMWLAPEVRGRGWAARALRLVAPWLIDACGIERVELLAEPDNEPMLASGRGGGLRPRGRAPSVCPQRA